MKKNTMFLLLILFSLMSTVASSKGVYMPITQAIQVQSPIISGGVGALQLPHDWFYAHIKCAVSNYSKNDEFTIASQVVKGHLLNTLNLKVDGLLMTHDYFILPTAGGHTIEFDVSAGDDNYVPLPESINFYNASTESLIFSNCTATSQ